MPFEGHAGIRFAHAFAIVYYLYQGFAGILDDQLYFRCLCVYGILQELFHGTCGTLDHLACSYLIGDVIG